MTYEPIIIIENNDVLDRWTEPQFISINFLISILT